MNNDDISFPLICVSALLRVQLSYRTRTELIVDIAIASVVIAIINVYITNASVVTSIPVIVSIDISIASVAICIARVDIAIRSVAIVIASVAIAIRSVAIAFFAISSADTTISRSVDYFPQIVGHLLPIRKKNTIDSTNS